MGNFKKEKIAQKKGLLLVLVLFVAIFLFGVGLAKAATVNTGIGYGAYTGLASTDIRIIVAKIIRAFLALLGTVALGLTLYGGYMYMSAGGNEEKVSTAKKILKNMAIGLAIILASFSITQFIINMLTASYQNPPPEEGVPNGGEGFCVGCGFLGQVVETHYPARDAVGIPRNTKIVITFKQKIKPESLIADSNGNGQYGDTTGAATGNNDHINTNNVKIYRTEDGEGKFLGLDPADANQFVDVFITADHQTIVLKPKANLGDGTRDFKYTVKLVGGVKQADGSITGGIRIDDGSALGKAAFSGIKNFYDWSFTVGTFLDLTPPFITSIIPMPRSDAYPRNILLQVNFSEGVDPISASGVVSSGSGFRNIEITNKGDGSLVNGEYKIGNQYLTVEFRSADQCGKNPCGQAIFCLPSEAMVSTTVKSASIDQSNVPQALIGATLYNGIVDLAGNSLNGGGTFRLSNGKYTLVPGVKTESQWKADKNLNDFSWTFSTSKSINTTAPALTAIQPNYKTSDVAVNAPLTMSFSKPMSVTTFGKIALKAKDANHDVWYTPSGINFNKAGIDIGTIKLSDCSTDINDLNSCDVFATRSGLTHGDFFKAPIGSTVIPVYMPFVDSLVNDVYQNCFYPAANTAAGSSCVGTSLNEPNKSCYDNHPTASTSTCEVGETCYLPGT